MTLSQAGTDAGLFLYSDKTMVETVKSAIAAENNKYFLVLSFTVIHLLLPLTAIDGTYLKEIIAQYIEKVNPLNTTYCSHLQNTF